MIKILDTGATEVDLKLIRAMFAECPSLNQFYISKRDIEWMREKHQEIDPIARISHFIDLSDPVWHTPIMMMDELDKTNVFIGTDEGDTVVMAVIQK